MGPGRLPEPDVKLSGQELISPGRTGTIPPCNATVGLMPVKVIAAAVTMVTVAALAREESTLEIATSVTRQGVGVVEVVDVVQVVGRVAGAVYFPVESTLPQPGSQCFEVVVMGGLSCVTSQVTSLGVA